MKQYICLIVICFFLFNISVKTQDIVGVSEIDETTDYIDIANDLFENAQYFEAIEYYEIARKQRVNRRKSELLSNLAECYRKIRNYGKAEELYKILLAEYGTDYKLSSFWLGRMQQANEKYQEAISSYELFFNMNIQNLENYKIVARNGVVGSQAAIEENNKPVFVAEELNIEGVVSSSFYGAHYNDSLLWMTTSVKVEKERKINFKHIKGVYSDYYVDRLYYTKKSEMNIWSDGKMVENLFYTMHNNYLPPSFSSDGSKMFVTICEKTKEPFCEIYYSVFSKEDGAINLNILETPINDEENFEFSSKDACHFSFNGNEWLVFASNRPGGQGGYDLYICQLNKEMKTTNVVSLGNQINSPFDEFSPYYDEQTQTLFFSSNGLPGYGSFDVFVVEGNPVKGWGEVKNMGKPVNSGADEYYYYQKEIDDDFLAFVSSNRKVGYNCCDKVYSVDKIDYKYNLSIRAFDKWTKIPIDSVNIEISHKGKEEFHVNLNSGSNNSVTKSLLQENSYDVLVSKSEFDTINIIVPPMLNDTFVDVYLDRLFVYLSGIVTDSSTKDTLDEVSMVFVDSDNLVFDSLKSDNPVGYRLKIPKDRWDRVEINKKGYMFFTKDLSFSNEEILNGNVIRNFALNKIEVGAKVIFHNIEFEFGSAKLKTSSYPELDRIYKFLSDNPDIKLEISGHTDNVGSYAINLSLSKQRAASVVDYLVLKGIQESRIHSVGFSYDKPIAPNDSDENRALNRRVEFEIIK